MNFDIEGVGMGDKGEYKIDQLCIVCEDGTKIPLAETALISVDNLGEDVDKSSGLLREYNTEPVTIELDIGFVNRKCLYKTIYGISMSNNYLRMCGGYALRERTRYRWYKRHTKRKE